MGSPSSKHIMLSMAPLLCSLCVIAALVYQLVYFGQYGADPMGIFTRQTKQMLNWSGAARTSMEFIDSGFVRRLASVTWPVTEKQLQEQVADLVVDRQQNLDSLSLIPEQSLLILDWADMAAATSGFFESRLGQQVNSINWPRVMKKLEVPEQLRMQLEERIGGLLSFVKSRLFRELFSGRMVVALLPVDMMDRTRKEQVEPQYKPSQMLEGNLLVIFNLRREYLLKAVLSLLSIRSQEGSQKKKFLYNGVNVFKFGRKNGREIYIYSAGRQLVASLALEPIQRSIDLYLHTFLYKDSGFYQNNGYKKLKKRAQVQDDFFVYADIAGIKTQINAFSAASETGREEQEEQSWKRRERLSKIDFPGLQRLALFHHSEENIQKFTSIVQFNQEKPESLLKNIFSRKAVLNHGLTKMPSNLLIYFWTNWIDLPGLWRENEGGAADKIAAWIEKQTGMSINYFLGLFGHEFGFNVDEISSSGFVPVPRICMCIEMKDRDRVEQLIEKMIVGMPIKRSDVAGQSVVSFMIADGLMQPSYAILRRFLVMADGPDQIENLLKGNLELLVDDPPFMEVDTGMRQPSNLVMFIRTEKLNEELKEIAIWAATIIGIGDKKAAAKSKELVNQVILPLLDGLKMYRAKGVRGFSAPGEVVFDIVLSTRPKDVASESMSAGREVR